MLSAYISKLMEISQKDRNVVNLVADSGSAYDEIYKSYFPKQIFNFGIAEENMVAAAAGMASVGKIPFAFTYGAFLAYRSMEFIRDDVCFNEMNVKIVGIGYGLSLSYVYPTHQSTEDISVLRGLPGLTILSPGTPKQVGESVELAYNHKGPVYIRIGLNKEKEFYSDDYKMRLSQNDKILTGDDITVYTTGSALEETHKACGMLKNDGINASLVNVSTMKPFGSGDVIEDCKKGRRIFTVEEHNIFGGLGTIVAEAAAYYANGVKVTPIGLNDSFVKGYGRIDVIRKKNGLDAKSIYEKIKAEI